MVLRLYGYGAWIESDGKPLEEYAVEVKGNDISCYVCSEEGKKFVLHLDDDGSFSSGQAPTFGSYGRSVAIKMDGLYVERIWGGVKQKVTSDGMYAGDIVRPYIFAPIDTTDDDHVATRDDPNHEHLGTIQMELQRSIKIGPATDAFQGTGPGTGPIHERSKKAGSHRIALGEGVYRPQNAVKVMRVDYAPWLTFRFLYRKRDILKAQGIVPQSPSPSPSRSLPGPSVKVKVEGMKSKGKGMKREREDNGDDDVIEIASDDDDLDSLQDELKRIQDQIARKKAKKPVKQEPVSSTDDVIDLT